MNKFYSISIALFLILLGSTTTLMAQPANDNVANAIHLAIDPGVIYNYDNTGATAETGEDLIAPPAGNPGSGFAGWWEQSITESIWFTFTAPSTGAMSIDLCGMAMLGTTHDTQIAVYEVGDSSDFSTFTLVAANDDWIDCDPASAGASQFASYVEATCLVPGQKYWFLIDGWQGTFGNAAILMDSIPAPPLALGASASRDPLCPGGSEGAVFAQVTGGGLPYSISWSNGATDTLQLDGLTAGTYTLNVIDACDSTLSASVTVSDPSPSAVVADAGLDASICFGETVELGGQPAGSGGTPDSGPNAYAIALAQTGGFLINSNIEATDDFSILGANAVAFDDLWSMDFAFGGILFAINESTNELVAINPDPTQPVGSAIGVMTPVTPDHRFLNLMFDEVTQTMYALSFDGVNLGTQLYTVDISTGAATPTVAIPLALGVAASFDAAGTLYVVDLTDDNLYTVDLLTGTPTLVGNTGIDIRFINVNDMDFDPATDRLYISAYTDNGNIVREIDLGTGLALPLSFVGTSTVSNGILTGGFAIAPVENPYGYGWFPPLALDFTDIPNPISSTPVTNTYELTVTDGCGVTGVDSVTVTVNDAPIVAASSTPDNGTGNGTATATVTGTGTIMYAWTDSAGGSVGATETVTGLTTGQYFVMVTDENGCSAVDSIQVGSNVGIEDLLEAEINAYPNPSSGMVTINIQFENIEQLQVSLTDMRGKTVWRDAEQTTSFYNQTADFSDLPSGVYLIQIQTEKGYAIKRLTIN